MVRLYFRGVSTKHDGSEADYIDVETEDEAIVLYPLGWRVSEGALLPQDAAVYLRR